MIASRSRQHLPAVAAGVAVALAAAAISVARLVLSNASALSDLVWAEDGLFPLCAKAHNPIQCAVEPYAGYLIVLPRAVAWPVSLVPMSSWPAATNIAAALLAAATAGAVVYVLRRSGSGWVCSAVVALIPVAAPIMGVEAINSTANSYALLPFVGCLALCLPPSGRLPKVWYAAGAFFAALTIPSSVVLLLPLAVQAWRARIARRDAVVVGGALLAGLVIQAIAVLSAGLSRSAGLSWSAVREFADGVPAVLLTNWPFYEWQIVAGAFEPLSLSDLGLGLLIVCLALVGGVILVLRQGYVANAVGLLLLSGLAFAVIPAVVLDSTNNRYYVLLLLLWAAAGVIALDRLAPRDVRGLVMATIAALLALLWLPSFPASEYRSTANPLWATSLLRSQLACLDNPEGAVAVEFSPRWPTAANGLTGLTTNVVPCSSIEGPHAG